MCGDYALGRVRGLIDSQSDEPGAAGVKRRGRAFTTVPLEYPDTEDRFYGYAPAGDTQLLMLVVGWIATAIIALTAGRFVARKCDRPGVYAEAIGDEWSVFQREVFEQCKRAWGYGVPHDALERAQLRALCERALAFENHYLRLYRTYLLAELRSADTEHVLAACRPLEQVIYDDADISAALKVLKTNPNDAVQRAACATLRRMADAGVGVAADRRIRR